eukprot:c188_g1_i1.p1 GENE.c188_g1_i1~~c188_g1_i1.p1  ORF type:complete len:168 (-),score=79.89 c188_g1_i1:12-479(-)
MKKVSVLLTIFISFLAFVVLGEQLSIPPRSCETFKSCQSCVLFSTDRTNSCGWCASEGVCLEGGLTGPLGSTNCTFWDYGFCSGEPCSAYSNPVNCQQDPFCIWCRDPASCMEGTKSGPLFQKCNSNIFEANLADIREPPRPAEKELPCEDPVEK